MGLFGNSKGIFGMKIKTQRNILLGLSIGFVSLTIFIGLILSNQIDFYSQFDFFNNSQNLFFVAIIFIFLGIVSFITSRK